ncbi:hypothetical protein RU99_GL003168 [Enterococcus casseliflavus]|nr:hypothetical protein RU99_GL003168 [Enterococcus casseliflavus]
MTTNRFLVYEKLKERKSRMKLRFFVYSESRELFSFLSLKDCD